MPSPAHPPWFFSSILCDLSFLIDSEEIWSFRPLPQWQAYQQWPQLENYIKNLSRSGLSLSTRQWSPILLTRMPWNICRVNFSNSLSSLISFFPLCLSLSLAGLSKLQITVMSKCDVIWGVDVSTTWYNGFSWWSRAARPGVDPDSNWHKISSPTNIRENLHADVLKSVSRGIYVITSNIVWTKSNWLATEYGLDLAESWYGTGLCLTGFQSRFGPTLLGQNLGLLPTTFQTSINILTSKILWVKTSIKPFFLVFFPFHCFFPVSQKNR